MASLSVIRSPKCDYRQSAVLPVVLLPGICRTAVEFAYRTLKNDAEVFPDESVLACASCSAVLIPSAFSFSSVCVLLPRSHQLAAAPVASSPITVFCRQRDHTGKLWPLLFAHCALLASVFVGAMPTPMVVLSSSLSVP